MPKPRKSTAKYITEAEHKECVGRFGKLYSTLIEPVLRDTGLYARGRWHKSWEAPCLYIGRDKDLYESEQRGIFLHIQETKVPNAIEIVFRQTNDFSPLSPSDWRLLKPHKFEPSNKSWQAFVVRNKSDIRKARQLLAQAIVSFDHYYEWSGQ